MNRLMVSQSCWMNKTNCTTQLHCNLLLIVFAKSKYTSVPIVFLQHLFLPFSTMGAAFPRSHPCTLCTSIADALKGKSQIRLKGVSTLPDWRALVDQGDFCYCQTEAPLQIWPNIWFCLGSWHCLWHYVSVIVPKTRRWSTSELPLTSVVNIFQVHCFTVLLYGKQQHNQNIHSPANTLDFRL